ncbi:MAG TPA: HlyD family secretion protein [Pseudolabrys sp.]|nr:HlyD family secretion protein [Pseudolabrys sp.]
MQSQGVTKEEISSRRTQLVGARGAMAAQRARAVRLAAVAERHSEEPNGPSSEGARSFAPDVDAPEARKTERPAPDVVPTEAKSSAGRHRRKLALIGAGAAIAIAAAGWFGYDYVTIGRFMVTTDDAYVRADATTLAAKVAGYVSAINVADNTYVHAGQVIARIDDGDYRLAVASARDKVQTQQAAVDRIGKQIPAQEAAVEQTKAQLTSAQASATRWQSELGRQQALAGKAFASQQTLEQTRASRDQAIAAVQSAKAAVNAAIANVEVLKAQRDEAAQQLQEFKTALAKAERDLSFTQIRAPIDGVLGNRAMQVGDYVQPGTRLASLVPLDEVYIDANFKETQLARLRAGQPVSVSVDALPEKEITGEVASISPASGAVFSLLPPDNATGNFTKIVQRLPVRIQLPPDVTVRRVLRPGMSVVVSVNTKPQPSVADRDARLAQDTNHSFRW